MVKMSSNLADLPADLAPLVVTSHGQDEFKFGRSTPRSADRSTPTVVTSHGQDEFKFGRSTPQTTTIAMHNGIYIMGCIWQTFWILQEKVGISFYF